MNFNLINQISKEDKIKIENYIKLYGVSKNFIGLDEWLKHWSANKIKMYKLLNNQLIYRVPFEYNKSEEDLRYQLKELRDNSFYNTIYNWFREHEDCFPEEQVKSIRYFIVDCFDWNVLFKDSIYNSIKFKLENSNKTFQIQQGAKPIRSLGKFITYCKDIEGINEIKNEFEKFRIAHSMILNDKTIKGTLAISIHPLDFMTMSDNDSNWSSCMSWKNEGCYHIGTVEMMNSNNVLCCYIENSEPYIFGDNQDTEEYTWNNKKWRQLIYFTKDIIVNGKPYPYANENISKFIIEIIRSLAKDNLGWTYSFGPELYQDMKHINGNYSMNRAKKFIADKNTKKFNILFDTKGMYNDMLNDNDTKYWCVRNKVKHTKVISYSGKAPCLCCGETVIEENGDSDYDYLDYNERYSDTGRVICYNCLENNFKCEICRDTDPIKKYHKIQIDNKEIKICDYCYKKYIRKCPDCGDIMIVPLFISDRTSIIDMMNIEFIKLINDKEEVDCKEISDLIYWTRNIHKQDKKYLNRNKTIFPICRCKKCSEKDKDKFEEFEVISERLWWRTRDTVLLSKKKENKANWEKYFPYNLEKVEND